MVQRCTTDQAQPARPCTPLQPPLKPVVPPGVDSPAPERWGAGWLAAHPFHLPPVPADLPALPSQLGSSQLAVAERPVPALVRRALECLEEPQVSSRGVGASQCGTQRLRCLRRRCVRCVRARTHCRG